MYRERMMGYYPQIIQSVLEFQAIIDGEHLEIEKLADGTIRVINDAYLTTMSEDRIKQWENVLGIQPIEYSSISDRRDTIIARIRGQGKLNTERINAIVNAFTGGTANSWIEDGVLYVEITPPPENKQFRFENVEQEIAKNVPAHLGLNIRRNYQLWSGVEYENATWSEVRTNYGTWQDVLGNIKREVNRLDETPLTSFVLG
jgi:hypothetical protein